MVWRGLRPPPFSCGYRRRSSRRRLRVCAIKQRGASLATAVSAILRTPLYRLGEAQSMASSDQPLTAPRRGGCPVRPAAGGALQSMYGCVHDLFLRRLSGGVLHHDFALLGYKDAIG